jgi:hypothetical protein
MTNTEVEIKRSDNSWSWGILSRHWIKINGEYMLKRIKIIQTPMFTVLLTKIYKTDSERYPHDHHRSFISFIISGGYIERVFSDPIDLDKYTTRHHHTWSFHAMPTSKAHTITYVEKPLWTLVFAGRMKNDFTFWTPEGKVDYREYGTGEKLNG